MTYTCTVNVIHLTGIFSYPFAYRWMDVIIAIMSKLVVFASTLLALHGNHTGGAIGIIMTYSLEVSIIK